MEILFTYSAQLGLVDDADDVFAFPCTVASLTGLTRSFLVARC